VIVTARDLFLFTKCLEQVFSEVRNRSQSPSNSKDSSFGGYTGRTRRVG
jgi:hypothetical protein